MNARHLLLLVALLAAPAWSCDKLQRTVEFLGWTGDATRFAWREHETCVGCTPKWVTERIWVSTTTGQLTEYVTRWEKMVYPRPDSPDAAAFAAWKKKFPLTLKSKAVRLGASQGGVPLKQNGEKAFCVKKEGPLTLTANDASHTWEEAPSAVCGCARGFPSPGGEFVAWITGPARRVCDDCHGAACCGDVQAFTSRVE